MRALIGVVAVAAMLATAGCGASRPTALEKATSDCLQSGSEWFEVQDEGKALHLQIEGLNRNSGLDEKEAECVLKAVAAPESTFTKMENTSMNDGEQGTSWDGHEASWTFDVIKGTSIQLTAK
jgi:hypothetical protein